MRSSPRPSSSDAAAVPARHPTLTRPSKTRGNLPGVTPFVFQHTAAVPIGQVRGLLERPRAGVDGTLVRRIGIAGADVQERRRRLANSSLANHDDRISDPDL